MARKPMNGLSKSTTSKTSTSQEEIPLKASFRSDILERHKPIYDLYIKTGEIVNFHHHIQAEIVSVYKEENPHYTYQNTCPACVAEMLHTVYKWYLSKIN